VLTAPRLAPTASPRGRGGSAGSATGGRGTATMPGSRGKSGAGTGGGSAVGFLTCGGAGGSRGFCGTAEGRSGVAFVRGPSPSVAANDSRFKAPARGPTSGFAGRAAGAFPFGLTSRFSAGFGAGFFAGPGTIMIFPHAPQRILWPESRESTSKTWPVGQRRRRIMTNLRKKQKRLPRYHYLSILRPGTSSNLRVRSVWSLAGASGWYTNLY
jgi:hypothetical protein